MKISLRQCVEDDRDGHVDGYHATWPNGTYMLDLYDDECDNYYAALSREELTEFLFEGKEIELEKNY